MAGFFDNLTNSMKRTANKYVDPGTIRQPDAPEGFTEFKSGADRSSVKISMEGKLDKQGTLYRNAVPTPGGSIPSVDNQTTKPTDPTKTGQGINAFGYGESAGLNPWSGDTSQIRTNLSAVGNIKIKGFSTFSKPMQASDYGKPPQGDPQEENYLPSAADSSFYRNYLPTPKYGDIQVATHNVDNPVGKSKVPVYKDGVEVPDLSAGTVGWNSIQRGNLGKNREKVSEDRYKGNDAIVSPPPPAPLRPVHRKMPSVNTGNDMYVVRYLDVNQEDGFGLYKAKGSAVFAGGGLVYTGIGGQEQGKYSSVLEKIRVDTADEMASAQSGSGVDKVDAGQTSSASKSNMTFESITNSNFGDEATRSLTGDDKSPMLTGTRDSLGGSRVEVRNLKNRMEFVYFPPKVLPLIAASPQIRKTVKMLDTTTTTVDDEYNIGENKASAKTDSVEFKNQKPIHVRRAEKYHPADILDETPTGPETNKDNYLDPETTLKRPDSGRAEASLTSFQEKYSTALEKLGMQGDLENYSDIKTLDVLELLAKESISLSQQGKSTEPMAEQDRGSLDSSAMGVEGDPSKRYGYKFSRNSHYIHTAKKIPDYSASIVGDDTGTNRIDQFNMYGVLDASDANLITMPEWATEDFIPMYFHDLVNKKYVPFRSFINSLSDQSDATWNETQYLGRADKVYVYSGFTRTMSVDFNVAAFSVNELFPMWQRINYMVGLTKPAKYSENGFIIPPFVRFNLGDIYRNQPVLITSVSTSIPQEASWELVNNESTNTESSNTSGGVKASEKNKYQFSNGDIQKDEIKVARYPTMCTLSVSMTTLEKITPETQQNHFGNLGMDPGTFNGDLSTYPKETTEVGDNATTAPTVNAEPGTTPAEEPEVTLDASNGILDFYLPGT